MTFFSSKKNINEGKVVLHPFSELKVIKLDDINEVTKKVIEEVKIIFNSLLNLW